MPFDGGSVFHVTFDVSVGTSEWSPACFGLLTVLNVQPAACSFDAASDELPPPPPKANSETAASIPTMPSAATPRRTSFARLSEPAWPRVFGAWTRRGGGGVRVFFATAADRSNATFPGRDEDFPLRASFFSRGGLTGRAAAP